MVATRTPGVFSRGSRYVATFYDDQGIQRKKAFRTMREAVAHKRLMDAAVQDGSYQAETKVTLHEYLDKWIEEYDQIRDNTREDYRTGVEYAKEFFGRREKLTGITPRRVREFVQWLQTEKKLKPSSVRKRAAPLSTAYRTAREDGLVKHNPCVGVRMPKMTRTPHEHDHEDESVKVFTEEQLQVILSTIKQRNLFELLACAGLRISEALALEWRHLELNGSSPHVKVRRGIVRGNLDAPKSFHGRRDVQLPFSIVQALRTARNGLEMDADDEETIQAGVREAFRGSTEALVESEGPEGSENRGAGRGLSRRRNQGRNGSGDEAFADLWDQLVFPSSAGTALSPNNLRNRVLQPALEEAGCAWAGFHTFRHTYASMQIRAGVNIVALSRALGHHSPAFTLNTYAHLMKGDEAPALELGGSDGQNINHSMPAGRA